MAVCVDNQSGNSVTVNTVYNTVNVIPDQNSTIVEVITPGPQGPQGEQGPPGPSGSIDTGSFATTGSNQFNGNQIITGSLIISGSSTLTNIGPAIFSGSLIVTEGITGSFSGDGSGLFNIASASFADSASYAVNTSFADSASFATTSSYSNNINGLTKYIALFDTENSLSSSAIHQSNSYSIIINREFGTANAPEALFVFQPNTESFNITTFESNVDNYSQINIRNESDGETASSDIVATANNGDEFINFVNMGINSSNFTGSVGGPNDAYLFSTGKNLVIGNTVPGESVIFFVGGGLVENYQKLILKSDDQHIMSGSLNISGSLIVDIGITGSLYGTSSFALDASISKLVTGSEGSVVEAKVNVDGNLFILTYGAPENKYLNIREDSETEFYTNYFLIRNYTTREEVFTVSQSIVRIAPQAFDPTGTTDAGSIWFTSSSMYVGLE